MTEIISQLLQRVQETGEQILELVITEDTQRAILEDDTYLPAIVEYNFDERIWE